MQRQRPRLASILVMLVVLVGLTTAAHARPVFIANDLLLIENRPTLFEWTTWVRGTVAVAQGDAAQSPVARASAPPETSERDRTLAGAVGAGFTLPLGARTRIGPFAELREWGAPVLGGELTLIAGDLDLFFYKAKSAITLRAGGSPDIKTAQLGVAYRAPWDLKPRSSRVDRYMIGVGIVANVTQSRSDARDWSATVGLELEPVGALRYLLGIRSWY